MICAGILASCANVSKRKGALRSREVSFFKDLSKCTSFNLSFCERGVGTWAGIGTNVVASCTPSGVRSYCFKYDLQTEYLLAEKWLVTLLMHASLPLQSH